MRTYEAVDAAMIRVTTFPAAAELPPWPDLTTDDVSGWHDWLRRVWRLSGFADAVRVASAELATQVQQRIAEPPLACESVRRARRLVETVARYLLRWASRATPFGLFAGVAPLDIGARASVRWSGTHRTVFRPDGAFVDEQVKRIERPEVLRTVDVVTNSVGFARGCSWILPGAGAGDGAGTDDHLWDIEVELTRPVRLAVETARRPIPFSDLSAALAAEAPTVALVVIEDLLAQLIARRVLLSAVRPPVTVTDPVTHLARYGSLPDRVGPAGADVRAGCSVTLPAAVVREAEQAASVLTLVAPPTPWWQSYHQAFLERYGPGAAVAVRELVSDSGLGYPAGFRGSHRREPRVLTARDTALAIIAQEAALDGCREVVLGDDRIARLTTGQRPPVPHTELRFSIAARTLTDLERGDFTLSVISGARHAGVTTGRFLHLLDDTERERFRRAYTALPTATSDAIAVQISGPPLARTMTAVARVPEILPLLPLGEYQEAPGITLDDLAVTGDAHRLQLISLSSGRPIEPMVFNGVNLASGQQPLARFLTEIWAAFCSPCRPFGWGLLARDLPFLPRVRHGRALLSPARWKLTASALLAPAEPFDRWRRAWEQLRQTYRLPPEVFLGADDVKIRLTLDEPAHLAILRSHLRRQPDAVLTETHGLAGWIDGRAHEITLTLARTSPPSPPRHPRTVRTLSTVEHRPGLSPWLYIKVFGRGDDILGRTVELDEIAGNGWWFIRYHEPEPHLRVRIPLGDAGQFGTAVAQLGGWADLLHADGLLHDYTINTYRPEARFGTGTTLAAAEEVFAADSHAVIGRLAGDRTVATAAGMIGITDGFTGDGPGWLIEHVDHHGERHAGDRAVSDQRDPVLRALAVGSDDRLRRALGTYRVHIEQDGLDPDRVLADLLHLHHVRMIGVDLTSERHCLRLARATARTLLARDAW
ncbi:lantibiotic dehydratase [Amycolatopsis sp. lyj-23]|uniref:lantibiotic dehydratase n=1 Tax=Amycolatopsis sp. lyj-23 TaxID=2789283 RepID=UPI00397C6D19